MELFMVCVALSTNENWFCSFLSWVDDESDAIESLLWPPPFCRCVKNNCSNFYCNFFARWRLLVFVLKLWLVGDIKMAVFALPVSKVNFLKTIFILNLIGRKLSLMKVSLKRRSKVLLTFIVIRFSKENR